MLTSGQRLWDGELGLGSSCSLSIKCGPAAEAVPLRVDLD